MTKAIKQLSKEIAEHLGIDPLPIKFEDLGDEDSRLYTQEEYVGIKKKYKYQLNSYQNNYIDFFMLLQILILKKYRFTDIILLGCDNV